MNTWVHNLWFPVAIVWKNRDKQIHNEVPKRWVNNVSYRRIPDDIAMNRFQTNNALVLILNNYFYQMVYI